MLLESVLDLTIVKADCPKLPKFAVIDHAVNTYIMLFQSYEEELSRFVQQVNEGKFIEPSGNPLLLLEELKQILEEAYSVRSRLLGLSKWKEAISGKPHDLSRVFR